MITLEKVAKRAGVSTATVSLVLNNTSHSISISEKTREKVKAAAVELGYVPSSAARMLRTGRSRTIGVLGTSQGLFSQFRTSGFVGESTSGMISAAIEKGYNLTLLTGLYQNEPEHTHNLGFGIADGLLVFNRDLPNTNDAAAFNSYSKPLVYLLEYPNDPKTFWCSPDDVQGGKLATQTLLNLGHRAIGFVKKAHFPGIFGRRQAGWETALRDAGVEPKREWILDADDPQKSDITKAKVTAFVCANDSIGSSFKVNLEGFGYHVPKDFSLIQFSYADANSFLSKEPITSVVHPLSHLVSEGVHMLIDLIEGRKLKSHQRNFAHVLTAGQTVSAKK
jgi:LacI family transcriptional regulator